MHIYIYIHMYVYNCIGIYIYMYTCIYLYIYITWEDRLIQTPLPGLVLLLLCKAVGLGLSSPGDLLLGRAWAQTESARILERRASIWELEVSQDPSGEKIAGGTLQSLDRLLCCGDMT